MTLLSMQSSFRAQLVMAEQRQLFDYWAERCGERRAPDRADINPAHFAKMLPGISLLEVQAGDERCRVRLAGSRLRDIYDRDITGCYVDEVEWPDRRDYWAAAFDRVVREGKPAHGVLVAPRENKEHLVQYWLRLPLTWNERPGFQLLLCLDCIQNASAMALPETHAVSA